MCHVTTYLQRKSEHRERALSLDSSNSGGSYGTGSEYSIPFHLYTSIIPLPMPIAGSKHKANDLDCMGDNDHQAK